MFRSRSAFAVAVLGALCLAPDGRTAPPAVAGDRSRPTSPPATTPPPVVVQRNGTSRTYPLLPESPTPAPRFRVPTNPATVRFAPSLPSAALPRGTDTSLVPRTPTRAELLGAGRTAWEAGSFARNVLKGATGNVGLNVMLRPRETARSADLYLRDGSRNPLVPPSAYALPAPAPASKRK